MRGPAQRSVNFTQLLLFGRIVFSIARNCPYRCRIERLANQRDPRLRAGRAPNSQPRRGTRKLKGRSRPTNYSPHQGHIVNNGCCERIHTSLASLPPSQRPRVQSVGAQRSLSTLPHRLVSTSATENCSIGKRGNIFKCTIAFRFCTRQHHPPRDPSYKENQAV